MSAVSVICMSAPVPSSSSAARPETGRLLIVLVTIAAVVSLAGLASLTVILVSALYGKEAWPGFMAIAWTGYPVAFLLMGFLILRSIRRRRNL